jgi:hypothetical protein
MFLQQQPRACQAAKTACISWLMYSCKSMNSSTFIPALKLALKIPIQSPSVFNTRLSPTKQDANLPLTKKIHQRPQSIWTYMKSMPSSTNRKLPLCGGKLKTKTPQWHSIMIPEFLHTFREDATKWFTGEALIIYQGVKWNPVKGTTSSAKEQNSKEMVKEDLWDLTDKWDQMNVTPEASSHPDTNNLDHATDPTTPQSNPTAEPQPSHTRLASDKSIASFGDLYQRPKDADDIIKDAAQAKEKQPMPQHRPLPNSNLTLPNWKGIEKKNLMAHNQLVCPCPPPPKPLRALASSSEKHAMRSWLSKRLWLSNSHTSPHSLHPEIKPSRKTTKIWQTKEATRYRHGSRSIYRSTCHWCSPLL